MSVDWIRPNSLSLSLIITTSEFLLLRSEVDPHEKNLRINCSIIEDIMDQNPGVFKRIKTLIANLKPFLFRNTTDEQTVAKNTVWLSISNFGGRMLKAVVIIYAARVLDPVRWGVVSYAITLAGFFTLFVDPGINVLLMREGAKAEEKHQLNLLSTTFYMKVVLIVLVVLFVLFVGPTFTLLPGAQFLLSR